MAHEQQWRRLERILLDAVHEQREHIAVGGMREPLARLVEREPRNLAHLTQIDRVNGAEGLAAVPVVVVADLRGHPVQHMLGRVLAVSAARVTRFLALGGERVLHFAQERAERDGEAGFLADFAHRRVPVRFVDFQFAFRPAPVIVFRAVHEAHLHVVRAQRSHH